MPATVTLSATILVEEATSSGTEVRLADVSSVVPGLRLWIDRELMGVVRVLDLTAGRVQVLRGVDSTAAASHISSTPVVIGRPDQFYDHDPAGMPDRAIPVSPWINVTTGTVWYAQGDVIGAGNLNRWWQQQATTYDTGGLGIRTQTSTPSSST